MDLGVTNSHFSSSVVLMWQECHWNLTRRKTAGISLLSVCLGSHIYVKLLSTVQRRNGGFQAQSSHALCQLTRCGNTTGKGRGKCASASLTQSTWAEGGRHGD